MGLFSSINTASSGLTAQRTRLDVIANNIANADSTRTTEGGPFRRSRAIFRPKVEQPYWRGPYLPTYLDNNPQRGVRIVKIEKDLASQPRMVYDPSHPDAIQSGPRKGYVEYSNVNIVNEMVDMISASRSYEANVATINGAKSMFQRALEIARA